MANVLGKPTLSGQQKTKLNELFEEIMSKASIDYNNREIKDIQAAVHTMLERVVTRVNERGIFNVSRIQPCGSMAERTALWKCDNLRGQIYTEFDFLAILDNIHETSYDMLACAGGVLLHQLPIDGKALQKYYAGSVFTNIWTYNIGENFDILFLKELDASLRSLCGCASVGCRDRSECRGRVPNVMASTGSETCNDHGCGRCVVDMPTGSLRANPSVSVVRDINNTGPEKCSLVLLWTRKAKSFAVYDTFLPSQLQSIPAFPIYVDFLPTLELFRRNLFGEAGVHECFIVPKRCCVCDSTYEWRKSKSQSEITYIVNEMSEKHKKCYKILKYLLSSADSINSYHVKTIAMTHNKNCSVSSDSSAECVLNMLSELLSAYQKETLKSFSIDANIFDRNKTDKKDGIASIEKCMKELCTVSEFGILDTLLMNFL